jgi:Leucine-rich repeat (LRR) protein
MEQKELLLERIQWAKQERWKVLSFNGERLVELPPEIGQLINLQALYLRDNQLSKLPVEIDQLTALQILDLSSNRLTDPCIGS